MPQGIALEFRRKFGQVDQLVKQDKKVTEIASIQMDKRYIIYIINKETFQQKPTYETMFYALRNLKTFCETNNIEKVALPRVGSGDDHLNWEQVRTMIRYIFKRSKIELSFTILIPTLKKKNTTSSKNFTYHH